MDLEGSKRNYKVVMVLSTLILILGVFFINMFKFDFLNIMTNNTEIHEIAQPLMAFFILNILFEGFKGFLRGVIKGLCLQAATLKLALVA